MTEYLKIPAFSKLKGFTPEYCRRLIAQGKITEKSLRRQGKRWLVDPVQANKDLENNLRKINRKKSKQQKIIKKSGFECLTLTEAQTKKEQYLASLRKLEFEEKSGKLIPADEAEREFFDLGRTIRDSLLNIPDRIGSLLAAESDEIKVTEILTNEIRQALEVLSK